MRVKSSVGTAVGLFVLYAVVVIGVAAVLQPEGAGFESAFSDLDNSRYLVFALLAGAVLGVVTATLGGWWQDVLADDRPTVGPVAGWARFFPATILVLILATTDYPSLFDVDGSLLVWIVAASVLVGISEELMFRGNILVCLRQAALSEERVWLLSSLFFALIHLGNIGLGADVGAAIGNTAIAFFGGTMFYVVRRASGSILIAMALHALWDFTLFTAEGGVLGLVRTIVYIVLVAAVIFMRRRLLFADTSSDTSRAATT